MKRKHSVSKSTSFISCGLKSLCQLNINYRVWLVAGQISQDPADKSDLVCFDAYVGNTSTFFACNCCVLVGII